MTTVFQVSIWSQIMAHRIDDLFEEVYIIQIKLGGGVDWDQPFYPLASTLRGAPLPVGLVTHI